MKKILFAAVALVAMASCATEDVISRPDNNVAIGFDTFVENSTRANDINASNLADFGVYGSVVNGGGQQGMIFSNQKVAGSQGSYTYSPAQYWIAGAKYDFVAIAPFQNGEGATWTYAPVIAAGATEAVDAANGTISFNNAAAGANQDLLFAEATKTTAAELTQDPGVVGFTFNHMLSRVKFTFTNGFQSNGNIKLAISNVHITNAAANGTLAVADRVAAAEWTAENFNLDVDFDNVAEDEDGNATQLAENGSGSTEHFYLIPAEATYNITFDVALYQAGVLVDTYARNATLTVDLNRGLSYNVKTTLNPSNTSDEGEIYPIEFTVDAVEDWGNYSDVALEAKTVATAQELATAIAEGGEIRLTSDITLSGSELRVAEDKEVNLDLNGNTLTVAALDPIDNYGKMTIANGKVAAGNTDATRRCIYNHGEMVIENMEFVQIYDERGAAINNEGKMTINNTTVDAVRYAVWSSGANAETIINSGTFSNETDMNLPVYAVVAYEGAKMTINGGTFISDHGCVCACDGSQVLINGGTFTCTNEYSAGSDWVFAGGDGDNAMNNDGSLIKYDESECVISGNIYTKNGCVVAF